MKVYFVRHGQTDGNANAFHQTPDTPLTSLGKSQAKLVAKRLKALGIDLIYASPHKRTIQTATIISKFLKVPIELWDSLAERKQPSVLNGVSNSDKISTKMMKAIQKSFVSGRKKVADEENFYDLNKRADMVLNHLIGSHIDQTVLCVSHATFIKFLISKAVLGKKNTPLISHIFIDSLASENTGVSLLEYDRQRFIWRVRTWNDTHHL